MKAAAFTTSDKIAVKSCKSLHKRVTCRAPALRVSYNANNADRTDMDRRAAILSLGATLMASNISLPALAEETEFATFYGMATPPTSYGGYGGNAKEDAKYIFEYPASWKSVVPNKVEKGTQGIDCRVFNPKNKTQQVFVITFGRAGEDNKNFRLADVESTFAGFAGADADMQDAVSMSTNKVLGEHEVDGQKYSDIQIDSPDVQYLASITVNMGKVYAMFVKSPTKSFKADEDVLRHILATFKTI